MTKIFTLFTSIVGYIYYNEDLYKAVVSNSKIPFLFNSIINVAENNILLCNKNAFINSNSKYKRSGLETCQVETSSQSKIYTIN